MTTLAIRPMTPAEIDGYVDHVARGYFQQRVEYGGEPVEVAQRHTADALARFFPDRRPAQGQHLFTAEVAGEVVGSLWLAEQARDGPDGQGWVYDIEIDPAYRGRGYGRALMEVAERQAREFGCSSLGLNVFGGNEAAIGMYEALGYRTTSQQMSKRL